MDSVYIDIFRIEVRPSVLGRRCSDDALGNVCPSGRLFQTAIACYQKGACNDYKKVLFHATRIVFFICQYGEHLLGDGDIQINLHPLITIHKHDIDGISAWSALRRMLAEDEAEP